MSMKRKEEWDSESLRWLHEIREAQYREAKGSRPAAKLKPVDLETVAKACRRLGLKVRVGPPPRKKRVRIA